MNARRPNCLPVPKYTPLSPRGAILRCSTKSLPRNTTIAHPNGRKNNMSGCFPVCLKCGESPCRLVSGHELYMSVTNMTAAPPNANGIPLCSSTVRSPRLRVSTNFSTIPFAPCPCSLLCRNSITPCSFSSFTSYGWLSRLSIGSTCHLEGTLALKTSHETRH